MFAAATAPARGHVYHFSQVVMKEEDVEKEKTWTLAFMVRRLLAVGGKMRKRRRGINHSYARAFGHACAK
ncbi:hypothetical protein BJ742DRAFT_765492 [Cladochytrium replicatum]|nr:hypothetical protein BJ742DRAFT_765492 [Cladochytrium replicatum]